MFAGFALLSLGCMELGFVLLFFQFDDGIGWVSALDWFACPSLCLDCCAGLLASSVDVLWFEGLLAVLSECLGRQVD